jgi:hypothetical protein
MDLTALYTAFSSVSAKNEFQTKCGTVFATIPTDEKVVAMSVGALTAFVGDAIIDRGLNITTATNANILSVLKGWCLHNLSPGWGNS